MKREAAGYGHEDTVLHEASSGVFDSDASAAAPPDNDEAVDGAAVAVGSVGSSSDDEEFFECDEGGDDEEEEEEEGGDERDGGGEQEKTSPRRASKKHLPSDKSVDSSVSEVSFKDAAPIRAEGRLAPMKNMCSLATGEPLFIPITQEPSPMTEDMLEEQAEVLAKLGSSAQGSQLRARMQSACLLSDMESFKAANPGCCLEDFVRWYSPRDYIEDEEEDSGMEGAGMKGEESSEMKELRQKVEKETPGKPPPGEGEESSPVNQTGENGSDEEEEEEELEENQAPNPESVSDPDVEKSEAPHSPEREAGAKLLTRTVSLGSPSGVQQTGAPPSPAPCLPPTPSRQRRGKLSQRMQIPGNMWVEVWHSARPVPARRQKRLFDDTKEAEKVLHFLSGLRPRELVVHLLPMLVHASVLKLAEKEDKDVPVLKTLTDQVISKAIKVTRGPHPLEVRRFEDVVRMIELAETVSSRAQSLKTKFTRDLLEKGKAEEELHNFVSSLLQHPEVEVRGGAYGPAGSAIHKLFSAAQKAALMILEDEEGAEASAEEKERMEEQMKPSSTIHDFPTPSAREYILRAMIPRPAPYSRVLPQRMYCVLVEGDYRLAGAFCSDTTFQ